MRSASLSELAFCEADSAARASCMSQVCGSVHERFQPAWNVVNHREIPTGSNVEYYRSDSGQREISMIYTGELIGTSLALIKWMSGLKRGITTTHELQSI